MKKRTILIILAVAAITATLVWVVSNQSTGQISYETAAITQQDVKVDITATGTLDAVNTVEVGTQVSGVISAINVDFNDKVEAGQVIAELDTRTLQTTVQDAKANLNRTQIQLKQAKRAYENAKAFNANSDSDLSIKEAQANLDKTKAQLELSQKTYERNASLFEKGVIAQADLENSQADFSSAQASQLAAEVALNKAKANVSNVDIESALAEYESAQANLVSAQAALEKSKINLDFGTITAPISGIVISREVEIGQTVAASLNTPTLFVIAADLTKMQIEASVDEADIGQIKEGQLVEFTVDAYLDDTFTGTVKQIRLQPSIVNNVVTYIVIVEADNPEMKLLPGMTANLTVIVDQALNAITIPNKALQFKPPVAMESSQQESGTRKLVNRIPGHTEKGSGKQQQIWILEDQKPVPRTIRIGITDGINTEIVDGSLSPGTPVITNVVLPKTSSKKTDNSTSPFLPTPPKRR
ncbi:MAG: RND transporter [Cyclobacteriaceae bacterium]|nr:MAG: RND transporter [Cyclobacteriaceae bacterium]